MSNDYTKCWDKLHQESKGDKKDLCPKGCGYPYWDCECEPGEEEEIDEHKEDLNKIFGR